MNVFTTHSIRRSTRIFSAALFAALLIPAIAFSQSPLPVNLLSAGNFVIVAATSITSVGGGIIDGNVALTPGSSMTGFPPGVITGTTHINDAVAQAAQTDLTTAYLDAQGRTANAITQNGDLGGLTLVPGLYVASTSLGITGDVTLDARGNSNAVWIFQVGSALTTASGSHVVLAGGALAKNIFWQVGSSATLGTGSIFYGNILAQSSITMATGTVMVGRSLARTGTVTADGTGSTNPDSLKSNTPIFSTLSRNVNIGSTHVDSVKKSVIVISNTGTANLVITSATSTNTAFASHLSSMIIAPGGFSNDTVVYQSTTPGADSTRLIFQHNGMSSPDTIVVHTTSVQAILATASRNLTMAATRVDSVSWLIFALRNTGTDTLRFTAATSTNSVFSSHLSALKIAPGGSIMDSVKYHPIATGADSTKLIFLSNATTSPDTIVVRALNKAAMLTTASRRVNLGSTRVGVAVRTIFTLTNGGNDTLRIASAMSSKSVFASKLSTLKIAPGTSFTDSITYTPTAVGPDSATLIFTSNAVTLSDTITLLGTGLSPSGVAGGLTASPDALGIMFPNPVSDATQLQVRLLDGERLMHAAMYDMSGRELQNWTSRVTPSGALSLHLGSLPNGEYIVRLVTTARMQAFPVVVSK